MRALTAIMVLAGLAMGIPLRKGASLGYQVDQTHFTTLKVTDSLATDTGTLWSLSIRDSSAAAVKLDSALAWNRGADTIWRRGSCLVPWDLSPQGSWDQNGATLLGPGLLSLNCNLNCNVGLLAQDGIRTCSFASSARSYQWRSGSQPMVMSLPDTGIFRYLDPMTLTEWWLRAVDGKHLSPHPWDSAAKLSVALGMGDRWIWLVDSMGLPDTIQWNVVGTQADSNGWIRRTISSQSGTFKMEINPILGKVFCGSLDSRDSMITEGMIERWSDNPGEPGTVFRTETTSTGQQITGFPYNNQNTSRFQWAIQSDIGPTRISYIATSTSTDLSTSITKTDTTNSIQIVLQSHNGQPVQATGIVHHAVLEQRNAINSKVGLESFLRTNPQAIVRILSPNGNSRILRGDAARLEGIRGVVLVQLRDDHSESDFRLILP
jgi:hypothetical protein